MVYRWIFVRKVGDIDWLLNTHVHGDHIGGHSLVTKYGLKTAALQYCKNRVELYDSTIKEYVASGMSVEDEPVAMALKLIGEVGSGMPDQLFLALHTVSEHLKNTK